LRYKSWKFVLENLLHWTLSMHYCKQKCKVVSLMPIRGSVAQRRKPWICSKHGEAQGSLPSSNRWCNSFRRLPFTIAAAQKSFKLPRLPRPFTETTYSTIDCSHLAKLTHCICMYVNEKAATGRRVGTSETAVTSLLTSRKKKIARRELSVQAMTQETTTWAACECRAQALNTHTNTQKEIIWNCSTLISRLQKNKQSWIKQGSRPDRPRTGLNVLWICGERTARPANCCNYSYFV